MNPKHLAKSVEHYTPSYIIEAARETMGSIDLDPASCAVANETVKAFTYYSRATDGLQMPWSGNIWINPPGGVFPARHPIWETKSISATWWRKLTLEFLRGNTQAIFLGFNIEILRTGGDSKRGWRSPMQSDAICIPEKRIKFGGASSPPHASAIMYLGPNVDRFRQCFDSIGVVRT